MQTLRITQFTEAQSDQHRVEISLDGTAPVRSTFAFKLSPQDQEDLRWYLEDYLQYPLDPAPIIAARIEKRIEEIGEELFRKVFESSKTADHLWARLKDQLNDTRIEIIAEVQTATAIPWELLRDPLTAEPLALRAQSFVRSQADPAQPPKQTSTEKEKVRVLLVICRPSGSADVPFRSVASRILKSLTDEGRDMVQLDVLRPPTFKQLGETLRRAKKDGQPYHILHFDGHGMYAEVQPQNNLSQIVSGLSALTLNAPRVGKHGYLLFENPQEKENVQLIDGATLGKLMVETEARLLVLNACQSAFAEAPTQPLNAETNQNETQSAQDQVSLFGSLAQEVMNTGVSGVVAMRYNLYVETAKQFVADLYAALAQGDTLGEAVSFGRKQLAASPLREIAFHPRALQDWIVPIVYESNPIPLFPRVASDAPLRIILAKGAPQAQDGLPPAPDVGFFGRDETLLALDRAFDAQAVVLLHAYAGSGKTTTAVEFARWYAQTGGVRGAVLFTSFETYKPLARVLDEIERVFSKKLESSGVNWLALEDDARREVTLQVMKQIPILWIWDNVEPISGFPQGTPSAWSESEQRALADFLRAARDTQAKFLLTSRRDERQWLNDLPQRIIIPPMPMQERVQLTRALAAKHGRSISEVQDWRPLLNFTRGNPLTITVLVGQALRNNLKSKEQIESFVEKLRAGEAVFDDEATQGRSKSLGASLNYGFQNAFNEQERKVLALLYFFQGFVHVDALRIMVNPKNVDWGLGMKDFTNEIGIAILGRAAEVGLLTTHGDGYYSIHPALPWYFKNLFDDHYAHQPSALSDPPSAISHSLSATRAFVEAMGELGNHYFWQYAGGNRDVIALLTAEEPNLLHARRLTRVHGWWDALTSTMQGLRQLYGHTGRRAEWKRLVEEIVPDFVDPATDLPLPGREEQWSVVTQYRVLLAEEARQWDKAERLQGVCVEWNRKNATPFLTLPPESLNGSQKNMVRTLGASIEQLGHIQREQGKPDCVQSYEESIPLYQRINDKSAEAAAAFNLGHAYKDLPTLRDLAQAERWYQRSLELFDERDSLGRSKCMSQLGYVSWERFKDARQAKAPEGELLKHLNDAVRFYQQTLDLLPPNAVDDLAVAHNHLGEIYRNAGDLHRALHHYNEAIRCAETGNNFYEAGRTRRNVALALAQAGRLSDAREYAYAALRNYEQYGEATAKEQERTRGLIEEIEGKMKNAK